MALIWASSIELSLTLCNFLVCIPCIPTPILDLCPIVIFGSIGLGFELQRAEFTLDDNSAPTKADVKIDGKDVDWFFEVHTNIMNHTISVSYGPVEDAIPSVQASLNYPGTSKPSDPFPKPHRIAFKQLSIQDLLLAYD